METKSNMIVSQIVAIAKNRVMGIDNKLPWHLPEDMKFFREKTKGHIMIMGRKTFESLGKPLPQRLHIVITRQSDFKYDHPLVKIVSSLELALKTATDSLKDWPKEVFILGGSGVFKESFPFTNKIYLTLIDKEFQGDTFYPEIPETEFKRVTYDVFDGPIPYAFTTWERNS